MTSSLNDATCTFSVHNVGKPIRADVGAHRYPPRGEVGGSLQIRSEG